VRIRFENIRYIRNGVSSQDGRKSIFKCKSG